ncbi:aldehyde dehydrogenase domain-containing protein [Lipomyces doorenjongii]
MSSEANDLAHIGENVSLIINGASPPDESKIPIISPVDGREIWTYSSATVENAHQAIEAAKAAFPAWASTNALARSEILVRAAEIFLQRREELEKYMKLETAADDAFIGFNILATVQQLKDIAGRVTRIQGDFPSVEDDSRSALVLKEPYGVILGIAPWNAPYILGTRAVAAALATGNTTILKGSELAPRCFRAIVDIFHDAGLPKGCFNLLFVAPESAAEVSAALIKHPAVAKINFTGSTAIGRIVASTAGEYLKPILLELGGKATAIVFEDANLKKAAQACLLGALLHSGQVCMATERILVHSSIASAFAEQLKETLSNMQQLPDSAPTLISRKAIDRVRGLIIDALGKGATCLSDSHTDRPDGTLHPVILDNVNPGMDIFYTESFGPVVTFHTFDTEEEALNIANDTEYGLSGAIFTENLRRGLRVAKKYTTGAVHINSMSIHDEPALPHGGTKSSGFGRFNSDQGLHEFLRTKVVTWEN